MAGGESDKSAKEKETKAVPAASTQEQPSTATNATVNPDWSGFQAYSPMPPHGFLTSSPQTHPYMWGVQHIMPPYGNPPHPYIAMYPHGGVYAHPSMPPGSYPFSPFAMPSPNGIAEASGNTPGSIEADGKPSDVKEKLPIKRSKGSLGSLSMITRKNNDVGKTAGASANGVYPKSAESASEGTSDGSDADSQNDSKSGGRQDSVEADGSQNGGSVHGPQNGGHNAIMNQPMAAVPISAANAGGALPGPTTNLNIGMDYWGAPATTVPAIRGKVPSPPVSGGIINTGSRDSVQSQLWLQDERELKRQRRKQSNRESARRSRLRKQAECDELAQRAEVLKEENASLRLEVNRIKSEYDQLLAENAALKEKLGGQEDFRGAAQNEQQSNKTAYNRLDKGCNLFGVSKIGGFGVKKCRTRGCTVSASTNPSDYSVPVSPLHFESPVGQLLAQILQTHPHLLPAAIDQQLEKFQAERDTQKEEMLQAMDLLSKRIAEVREKERRNALEEIIYSLIVQKFLDNGISMIPKISATSDPTGRVDVWPNQEQKLESVHSPEAFEMIQSHLAAVLGDRLVGPLDTVVHISKIKLGKLYAASIMYGYFLRRVDQRYELERSMNTLPEGFDEERARYEDPRPENQLWDPDSLIRLIPDGEDGVQFVNAGEEKSYRLRSYVMYLDAETLHRYATIRSRESISLIEKQTQALFGRPDVRVAEDGSVETGNDEMISLSFAGLTMLVLEAVAFGSFLWDAESYVESKCHFLNS